MKLNIEIHTFRDTMNVGNFIGTVTTIIPNGEEHGFFVEGGREAIVLADITDGLGTFIHNLGLMS